MKGHTDICRLFLSLGADVNQSTDSSDTALSLAIWQNHTAVCIVLIDSGADVDNVDKFGDTMLLDAAKHGNVAVMRRLLEKQTHQQSTTGQQVTLNCRHLYRTAALHR